MSYLSVDLLAQARDATYFSSLVASNLTTPGISLLSYSPQFPSVLGESASARQVADLPWRAFHESGIYNKKDNALYITSNYRNLEESINITIVSLDDHSVRSSRFPNLSEANGGSSYYPPGADQTQTPPQHVYCDQGHLERYSQLLAVDPNRNTSEVLLTNYQGRNFSSINDVRQHPVTGDLWFTDTSYGHIQSFRPEPSLPQQVYRFEPSTGVVQAVADGFVQPNGLEFSPDFQTLYVSDTGAQGYHFNATGPATIYAYDVVEQKMLSNRRIFAFADSGFPDGIQYVGPGLVRLASSCVPERLC